MERYTKALRAIADTGQDPYKHLLDILPSSEQNALAVHHSSQPMKASKRWEILFLSHGNPDDDTTSSSDDEENATAVNGHHQPSSSAQPSSSQATEQPEPMDEDEPEPGWTVVKTKRKK
ncbi:unnamed protein product [Plutella xylostella]|uniref:(diamondback moth) hypothetical protein n=1 Tax=Plutella xylostella TaxID=51655 RepID=A0A8S4E401_PLUXY|nr:unnamed protein product [Plutella xylostella]